MGWDFWDVADMRVAQKEDNSVGPVYKLVVGSGEKPS